MLALVEAVFNGLATLAAFVAVYVALYVNHDARSPEVVAYLEYDVDSTCMSLVVSNSGSGAARDVVLKGFDYAIVKDTLVATVKKSFVSTGIPVLVPGASRRTVVNAGPMGDYESCCCEVHLIYRCKGFPWGIKQVEDSFILEYGSFSGAAYVSSEMHKLVRAVTEGTKTLKRIEHNQRELESMLARAEV